MFIVFGLWAPRIFITALCVEGSKQRSRRIRLFAENARGHLAEAEAVQDCHIGATLIWQICLSSNLAARFLPAAS